ncbi:hypothetical protein K435DRAFT_845533 [Dendrothele bispora CBS 962.96]|uniref:Uncharacterized protein n=1 Tax=Dendrothele bispora (strain CBS 962.96) TaxID=1314807 RepID=A0A4V4HBF8_DENBC|nr:hypothetical protein K435DRAFT_845533 [Dendrothele bispora CBS 962.96]
MTSKEGIRLRGKMIFADTISAQKLSILFWASTSWRRVISFCIERWKRDNLMPKRAEHNMQKVAAIDPKKTTDKNAKEGTKTVLWREKFEGRNLKREHLNADTGRHGATGVPRKAEIGVWRDCELPLVIIDCEKSKECEPSIKGRIGLEKFKGLIKREVKHSNIGHH